ncbi:MAG: putative transposase [Haloquadratum walsbyi J07HQW2]|uniref:Putative transposase n=1 Tax=Haloquadratum walsbyi J07HQW2 TaxID=1238425 RepID=U1N1N4_9EURY|nr:MAG: putative transposase [Haloquadratum walsbyi J07HQW2]
MARRAEPARDWTRQNRRHVQGFPTSHQSPVTIADSRLDSPLALASEEAALDGGANNLIACTISTGTQYLYSPKDAPCSRNSVKPPNAPHTTSHSSKTSASPASASTACTANALSDAITPKTALFVTSWNDSTTRRGSCDNIRW